MAWARARPITAAASADNCTIGGVIRLVRGDGGVIRIGEGTTFNQVGLSMHERGAITFGRAFSVGILAGQALLDLDYEEDFAAEVDMNVVGNAAGELLEVQGTAEKRPFTPGQLAEMVALAQKGLAELHQKQLAAIAGAFAK